MPFFAIFLIPAWFVFVDGRLSDDEGPIIGIEFGYPYSRVAIQGQDLSSLEILAEVHSSLNTAHPRIGHEPCHTPNVYIEDLRVLIEPASSIRKYQEEHEIYNSGSIQHIAPGGAPFTPEYLLGLLFEKLRVAAESVSGQNIGGAVVSIPYFYVTDFQRRVLHSLVASNLEVRQIIPAGTAATSAHGYPSQGHKFIDYYLICTKERCGIQLYDDGYDEMLAIAEDLRGEGIIEDLLKGAGILARDILHVIIIDEPSLVLRQQVEVNFPGKILPPDPYAVLRGATLKARWLSEPEVTCAMSIIPFGLGVQLSGGIFGPVIMRNTILPKQASRSGAPWELEYTNSSASQLLGTMDLPVVEGTAAPFDVIISVAIDKDGLMNFTAIEGDRQTSMVVPFPHNPLTEEDVAAMVNEAEEFARSERITDVE
ncbi:hypothetical protein EDD85DRAFT_952555 [Armillaria nabsnona]|nr:hypothetical protein EDD85DRAFT_952555 [Armillaria nabsnona]